MPSELKRISLFYVAFQSFFSLFLWLPVFYQFQKLIGLDDRQIFNIQSLYYLAFFFLEIPTGWIADRWGYRASLLVGTLTATLSNLFPVVFPSFGGMLAHFLGLALSRSLISGAANAYLFEEFDRRGERKRYKVIEGHGRAWGLVAKVIAWPFVGFLMERQLNLPYLLTTVFLFLSFLSVVALPKEPSRTRSVLREGGSSPMNLKTCLATLGRSPWLILLMIQGTLIFVMGRVQITFYQPILLDRSVAVVGLGGILSVITLFEAVGSWGPIWLGRFRISDLRWLFLLSFGLGLTWFLIAAPGKIASIAGFSLFGLLIGILFPIQKQVMNEAITDPRFRATLLSIESLINRLASAGVIAVLGSFTAEGRLSRALIGFAVIALILLAGLYLFSMLLRGRGLRQDRAG